MIMPTRSLHSRFVTRALGPSVLLGGMLLGQGCAYYSEAEGKRLKDEVYALQTQVSSLQATLLEVQGQQSRVGKQLGKVSEEVTDLNSAARRNDADIGVVLDVVRQDVAQMKGTVSSLEERMSEVEVKAEKTQEETELRFKDLDESKKDAEVAQAQQAAQDRLLADPEKALAEAERLIEAKQPAEARRLVRALEIEQRDSKQWGVYAPKAQYLIGETYFAEGDYRQAAGAFNTVRKKYPRNDTWIPGSILKLGMCFEELGKSDDPKFSSDAKLFYQTVAKKYPKHPAGKEARRRLEQLDG